MMTEAVKAETSGSLELSVQPAKPNKCIREFQVAVRIMSQKARWMALASSSGLL